MVEGPIVQSFWWDERFSSTLSMANIWNAEPSSLLFSIISSPKSNPKTVWGIHSQLGEHWVIPCVKKHDPTDLKNIRLYGDLNFDYRYESQMPYLLCHGVQLFLELIYYRKRNNDHFIQIYKCLINFNKL